MLKITVPGIELWDEINEEFVSTKDTDLQLEHSLVSISKWESKWHKPFLSKKEKSTEELIDYIKCMTITQGVNPEVYNHLSLSNVNAINHYIEDSMTATTFSQKNTSESKEIITSELIYYWMITLNIPVEFQKWHLNRLLTLIRVCNIKNQPPKKMSTSELLNRNTALNAERRRLLNTSG